MRSAVAAKSAQKGSHKVCGATARVAPAMSIANGSGVRVSVFRGSATVESKLFQTALPVRESFTQGHLDAWQPQTVAQAAFLGKHDPAGEPRQPRLRVHAGGASQLTRTPRQATSREWRSKSLLFSKTSSNCAVSPANTGATRPALT